MAVALKDLSDKELLAMRSGKVSDLSDDELRRVAEVSKRMKALERSKANIAKDQEANDPTAGMSGGQKFLAGVGSGMSDMVLGARQLGAGIGIGNSEKLRREVERKRETDAPLLRTGAGMAGNIAGQIAATAPLGALGAVGRGASLLKLARAGAAQGGATGALMPATSGGERLRNIGVGAGLGAAIPAGLRAGGRIAAAQRPLDDVGQAMRRLQDEGIVLTRADTIRNPVARGVSRAGLDTTLGQAGRASGEALRNKSTARAILRHIGEDADDATPPVLNRARERIGKKFDSVFSEDIDVPMTQKLDTELAFLDSTELPHLPAHARALRAEIKQVRSVFADGNVPGSETMQFLIKRLRDRASQAKRGQAFELADKYGDLVELLEDATYNAAGPKARARLADARRQWRNLKAIEKAADRDWGGGISPKKLAGYLANNRYTKATYQRAPKGSLELLARDLDTISDHFPNSGTAARVSPILEAGAAVGTGGATVPLSAGNYLLQRGLGSRAPKVGSPGLLARTLKAIGNKPNAGRVANTAAVAPALSAMQNDPRQAGLARMRQQMEMQGPQGADLKAIAPVLQQIQNDPKLLQQLVEMIKRDPESVASHLNMPPEAVIQIAAALGGNGAPMQPPQAGPSNPSGDITMEQLEAMFGGQKAPDELDAALGGPGRQMTRPPATERVASRAASTLGRIGKVDEAEKAAILSGFPGHREGAADRVRHRQWNSAMARDGLFEIPGMEVPQIAKAATALVASGAFEAMETGKEFIGAMVDRDLDRAGAKVREGMSDLRSNLSGVMNQYEAKDKQDTARRNLVGAVKQAIREHKITQKQGQKLLAVHGLSLDSPGR